MDQVLLLYEMHEMMLQQCLAPIDELCIIFICQVALPACTNCHCISYLIEMTSWLPS